MGFAVVDTEVISDAVELACRAPSLSTACGIITHPKLYTLFPPSPV